MTTPDTVVVEILNGFPYGLAGCRQGDELLDKWCNTQLLLGLQTPLPQDTRIRVPLLLISLLPRIHGQRYFSLRCFRLHAFDSP